MPRGRLIFAFIAEIARLDTEATVYDDVFRAPVRTADPSGEGGGVDGRQEQTLIQVKCQIEDRTADRLDPIAGGNNLDTAITLVFHFKDLEKAGLVLPNGKAAIQNTDRLVRILDKRGIREIQVIDEPELFATQPKPQGFGLGAHRNLLEVTFEEREKSVRRA